MAQLCERLVELGALPETFEPLHRWARVRLLATLLEEARGGPGPGGAAGDANRPTAPEDEAQPRWTHP